MPMVLKVFIFIFFFNLWSCGGEDSAHNHDSRPEGNKVEGYFDHVASQYGIPVRLLLATSYLETQISNKPLIGQANGSSFNLRSGQSIFGIPLDILKVEQESLEGYREEVEAYASYLNGKVKDLGLSPNPVSSEEKFQWVWEIAKIHRQDKVLRIIFVRELIALLNKGFIWNHWDNKGFLVFPKELIPIDYRKLNHESIYLLDLKLQSSEVRSASKITLSKREVRTPLAAREIRGIEVIHCPLGLSACIQLQKYLSKNKEADFNSHYIIPSNREVIDYPIQLELHSTPLPLSQPSGSSVASNHIIIMLTGRSGHVMGEERTNLQGDWFTKWQLERMSEVIKDICYLRIVGPSKASPFSLGECLSLGKGVNFRRSADRPYSLGDIPDFDEEIFGSYLGVEKDSRPYTSMKLQGEKKVYNAGEEIQLGLQFSLETTYFKLEELTRCSDESLLWRVINSEDVRSLTSMSLRKKIWDLGPNGDGSHFYRVKSYGFQGQYLGWDSLKVYNISPNLGKPRTKEARKC